MNTSIPDSADYDALRHGAAWCSGWKADWLRLAGADRLRFANAMVSCDLRSLEAGEGVYGFFTDPKGKIIADAVFLATEDTLWVELPAECGATIREHMLKYVVADRVEIEQVPGWLTTRLAGPAIDGPLADVLGVGAVPQAWNGESIARDDAGVLVRGDRRLGVPSVVMAGNAAIVSELGQSLAEAGVRSVGASAMATVRIEEGIPWFTPDLAPGEATEASFPQESGIEDWAVSYDKGCYLGQEVIARIHFRGKVNRSLRGLVFEPNDEPQAGAALELEGDGVGAASSIAYSPLHERPIGLGIVHHKAEPGTTLTTPFGSCRLVELPFGANA
ncbi:MAG: YgfZ/GcvT domain-containing protein [Thermoanaerobaculia bacterium]